MPYSPLLHRPEDAARLLQVSRSELYLMLASGEIESVKIGKLRRVPHEALVAYVARLRSSAGTPAAS